MRCCLLTVMLLCSARICGAEPSEEHTVLVVVRFSDGTTALRSVGVPTERLSPKALESEVSEAALDALYEAARAVERLVKLEREKERRKVPDAK